MKHDFLIIHLKNIRDNRWELLECNIDIKHYCFLVIHSKLLSIYLTIDYFNLHASI